MAFANFLDGLDIFKIEKGTAEVIALAARPPDFTTVRKNKVEQAPYRYDCMKGVSHPMEIESECYTLVMVAEAIMDIAQLTRDERSPHKFNREESAFIGSLRDQPKVTWALANSFDGLYVYRVEDVAWFSTTFRLAVYMKEEHATFWKLKYHGV